MGDKPIKRAQIALSGEGLRSRVATAEAKALGPKPKPKPKVKAKPRTTNIIKPKKKYADARAAENARLTAVDNAIIEARGLRSR